MTSKPRIAHIAGSNATVTNSPALVTSNKAREKRGLALLQDEGGTPARFDALRPQRLAAPVKVYVEQFSAHPLERDAAELYGPPDGYLDRSGVFHREALSASDVPVYEITLKPEDGLYPLPYMAVQADGQPWEDDCAYPDAPASHARQPFYPDGTRLFEEIDRFGINDKGVGNLISSRAEVDFFRVTPPAGYTKGDPPEVLGRDFFPYRPHHLGASPSRPALAAITNSVQHILASGRYAGAIWTQGSPRIEETIYWLNLLIDTTLPICGNSSQRPHGSIGNDGDHNIVDSVSWILSEAWKDESGCNAAGVVAVLDQLVYTAREVQKADARPGGYVATGGHGGIIGSLGHAPGGPVLTFVPGRRHTYKSAVNLRRLPQSVVGVRRVNNALAQVPVRIRDDEGWLVPAALPQVRFVKSARYLPSSEDVSGEGEVEVRARIEKNLSEEPLAGFVAEGQAGNAKLVRPLDAALLEAAFSGMPVVRVGRGNAEGVIPRSRDGVTIGGSNLTANKARILLMACMMKLGALPPAADPKNPTAQETAALKESVAAYQAIFDTH